MPRTRFVCLVAAIALAASAQTKRSVEELVKFVQSAIQKHEDDRQIASAIQNLKLASHLDESTVTDLQHMGAGPKTVAALKHLAETSGSLPEAAPPAAPKAVELPPAPSEAELKQIVEEVRQNALHYTESLPNYVCTQVTNRHIDPRGTGSWTTADQIIERLTFFEHQEKYQVKMVNNTPVTNELSHEKLGGSTSSGEFGSLLHSVFAPESRTTFAWERWTGLQKRWTYVLSFETGEQIYRITHGESKRTINARMRGSIFADRDTKMVMRMKLEASDIPRDFPIQSVSLDLSYDFVDISGQTFLLPLKSDIQSREGSSKAWNETSFVSYHKYSADTSISFDTPDEKTPPPKKK